MDETRTIESRRLTEGGCEHEDDFAGVRWWRSPGDGLLYFDKFYCRRCGRYRLVRLAYQGWPQPRGTFPVTEEMAAELATRYAPVPSGSPGSSGGG